MDKGWATNVARGGWGGSTHARNKAENKCLTRQASSRSDHPLLSFDLPDLKVSIQIPNISAKWTADTFETVQSCRIKGLPFKSPLFLPDGWAQSSGSFFICFMCTFTQVKTLTIFKHNNTNKWKCVSHPYCSGEPCDIADVPCGCNKPNPSPATHGLAARFVFVPSLFFWVR